MKEEIILYFCKKCKVYTDPRFWIHDKHINNLKKKCCVCGTENKYKLIKFMAKDIERIYNEV